MVTGLEVLICGINDWEDLVDLVTQMQRVNVEITLTKKVLNEKVFVVGGGICSQT